MTRDKKPIKEPAIPDYPELAELLLDRRAFLVLMGTAGASASLVGGCGGTPEHQSTATASPPSSPRPLHRSDTHNKEPSAVPASPPSVSVNEQHEMPAQDGEGSTTKESLFHGQRLPLRGSHEVRLPSGRIFRYWLRIVHDTPESGAFWEKHAEEIFERTDRIISERFGDRTDISDSDMADADDAVTKAVDDLFAGSDDDFVQNVTVVGVSIEYFRKPNVPMMLGRPRGTFNLRHLKKL